MGAFFTYWSSSNWPVKGFLEPLNHENTYVTKSIKSTLYVRDKNRSIVERRYSQQQQMSNSKEASASQFKYLQTIQNQKF